jgi:phosphate transport system permease protein
MTDARSTFIPSEQQRKLVARGIRRRRRAEWRFRAYGIVAISFAVLMLGLLLVSVVSEGWSAFFQTSITIEVALPKEDIDPDGKGAEAIREANYQAMIEDALIKKLGIQGRDDERLAARMISAGSDTVLRNLVLAHPELVGKSATIAIPAASDIDMAYKGRIRRSVREQDRQVKDKQFQWIDALAKEGAIGMGFNWRFFSLGDSNEPELAGILGALAGSAYTMLVTLLLCFPIGVAAAIYLEEYAPKNRLTDLIEVNVNNLAAVPSIVFGQLGHPGLQ